MVMNYQKKMSAITSDASTVDDDTINKDTTTDENEEEDEEEEEQDNNIAPVCECGRVLDSGWQCSNCRRQCPICNRVLSLDPDEYCERCYRRCDFHGLYTITTGLIHCPLCNN